MAYMISYDGDSVEIENAEELFVALEVLPPNADALIFAQLGEKMCQIVTNDEEFLLILEKAIDTRGASKMSYLECFGQHLGQVVSQGETVRNALALLADEGDQEYFLRHLGQEVLQKCMASMINIAECLEWLYGKMDHLFLDLLGWDFVVKFVSSGQSLGLLAKSLGAAEQAQFLECLGWDRILKECIQDTDDLMYIFVSLGANNDRVVIDKLIESDRLHKVIPSRQELDKLCLRGLNREDAIYLREKYA